MATSTEFVLDGDPTAARDLVMATLTDAGFRIEDATPGWHKIVRGSAGRTALLGGLAGKGLHMSFLLGFGTDEQGRPTVRLDRDVATSALKGGALGASKTAEVYRQTVDAIGAATTSAGTFVASRELA